MCLTTVILAPGASIRGCELQVMFHFSWANHGQTTGLKTCKNADKRHGRSSRLRQMVTCCIYDSFYNDFEGISWASDGKPQSNHGLPLGKPRANHGQTTGLRKGRGRPQRGPRRKSQNYIHINEIYTNSRSTAIQRPASIVAITYCLLIADW